MLLLRLTTSYVSIVINLILKRCTLLTFYMYLCYVELLNGLHIYMYMYVRGNNFL